jgi:DNA-binding NarL/FixJ family response regulator
MPARAPDTGAAGPAAATSPAIRVVLGEDNYLLREGIRHLLGAATGIELVATAGDFDGVLQAIAAHDPDVLITDIRMPPTDSDEGLRIAHRLRTERPQIGVVVLTQHAEPEYALALLETGAAGRAYLLKEHVTDIAQLLNAVGEVAHGGSVIDPTVVDILIAARARPPDSPLAALTPRENDVLALLAQGKTNTAIAAALYLTARAVEKHINSIFTKLRLTEDPETHRRVKAALVFLADQTE